MDIQAFFDMFSEGERAKRGLSQMTLIRFIQLLEELTADKKIIGIGYLDSYRGYYADLAFSPTEDIRTVGEVLLNCKNALGQTFEGYKGGDFVMGEHTPLWLSAYGSSSGQRVMGLDTNKDPIEVVTELEEWD